MQTTVSITPNFQIHIPKKVREAIGLTHPSQAKMEVKNKKIIIEPIDTGILKLAGSLKDHPASKDLDIENIRDHIDYTKA